jgi:hypothetical protein
MAEAGTRDGGGGVGTEQLLLRLSDRIDGLSRRMDEQARSLEAREAAAAAPVAKPEERTPWWTIVAGLLAIPAALVTMYMQFNQAQGTLETTERTGVEIEKLRTEELKARTELELLLEDLRARRDDAGEETAGETATRLEALIPRIEAAQARLDAAAEAAAEAADGAAAGGDAATGLLLRYLLIWVALFAVGLFFEIVQRTWSLLLNLGMDVLFVMRPRWPKDVPDEDREARRAREEAYERRRRTYERILAVAQVTMNPLRALPGFLDWALRIFVFAALILPFGEAVAATLGAPFGFESIWESVAAVDIGEAVGKLRVMLGLPTGSASSSW